MIGLLRIVFLFLNRYKANLVSVALGEIGSDFLFKVVYKLTSFFVHSFSNAVSFQLLHSLINVSALVDPSVSGFISPDAAFSHPVHQLLLFCR